MEKNDIGFILIAGASIWYLSKNTGGGSVSDKREALINLISKKGEDAKVFYSMSDQEISDVYTYIFDYVNKNRKLTQDNPLWYRIQAIGTKYNIFT